MLCGSPANVPNCNFDVSPDGDLIQNGAPDAVALLLNGTLVDRVSYEGLVAGFSEGSTAPTDTAGAAESIARCPNGTDTGDNGADFQLRSITPGATNNCGGVDPGVVLGSCGESATLISAIQGASTASPLVGMTRVIEGVVVADFQETGLNGFYVQEQDSDSDGNSATSEGIFVFEGSVNVPVSVGDVVRVKGTVTEFGGLTELTNIELVTCPQSGAVTTQVITLPVANLTDFERYEGMSVTFSQTLTVTGNFEWGRFGTLDLSANGRLFQPTQIVAPNASAAQQSLNDRSRIALDDGQTTENPNPIPYKDVDQTRRLGNTVAGLTGVLDERFGAYRIQPTSAPMFTATNPRQGVPAVSGRLKVAAFNVLNFFTTIDTGAAICGPTGGMECRGADSSTELTRQREKLLNAIQALNADVVGLIEIENAAPPTPMQAVQSLVDGLNARMGAGTYALRDTGTIGTDAIKLAFIYKPAKVALVSPFAILTSAQQPLFDETRNRPALAQTFSEIGTGSKLTVVLNHLKSKGSACGAGDDDTTTGQGNCNVTRTEAAQALLSWIASDPTDAGDPDYLLMGDLNAYAKEDPIATFEAGGLVNLEQTFLGSSVYSYQFSRQSGTLDYALSNASLRPQVAGLGVWHINSDEPVVMGYNQEFKTDDPFNINDPFGASDHDPILVGLNLTVPPPVGTPVPANGPKGLILLALAMAVLGGASLQRGSKGES